MQFKSLEVINDSSLVAGTSECLINFYEADPHSALNGFKRTHNFFSYTTTIVTDLLFNPATSYNNDQLLFAASSNMVTVYKNTKSSFSYFTYLCNYSFDFEIQRLDLTYDAKSVVAIDSFSFHLWSPPSSLDPGTKEGMWRFKSLKKDQESR